jgi:hypothetical protein
MTGPERRTPESGVPPVGQYSGGTKEVYFVFIHAMLRNAALVAV